MNYNDVAIAGALGALGFFWFIGLALGVVGIIGMWKAFEKADEPGWAAIIPIYNMVVMMKIGGLNPLLVLLMFVPLANVIIAFVAGYKFVEAYGFSVGGFLLYLFFSPFMLIYMGFSDSVRFVGKKYVS